MAAACLLGTLTTANYVGALSFVALYGLTWYSEATSVVELSREGISTKYFLASKKQVAWGEIGHATMEFHGNSLMRLVLYSVANPGPILTIQVGGLSPSDLAMLTQLLEPNLNLKRP